MPGSGKDELGKHLVTLGYQRFAFADGIREDLHKLNPLVQMDSGTTYRLAELVDEFGWDSAKRGSQDVRGLLQRYGSEVGREGFGQRCWIHRLDRRVRESGAEKIVITDVRFSNELEYLRTFDCSLWFVERPGYGVVNNHASERQYEMLKRIADEVVVNDGTTDALLVKAAANLYLSATHGC